MTPEQRKRTEDEIAKFEAALADPWRVLRHLEKGIDPVIIHAEEVGMQSQIDSLRSQLGRKT